MVSQSCLFPFCCLFNSFSRRRIIFSWFFKIISICIICFIEVIHIFKSKLTYTAKYYMVGCGFPFFWHSLDSFVIMMRNLDRITISFSWSLSPCCRRNFNFFSRPSPPNYFSAATALRLLKQVYGSTMGGPLSVTFSNIYIGVFLECPKL